MNVELENVLNECLYLIEKLKGQTEENTVTARLCVGGVILSEYLKNCDAAVEKIAAIRVELLKLQADLRLFEQQQQMIGM